MRHWFAPLVLIGLCLAGMSVLAAPPRTVVIGGDIAEIVAALDASDQLVGRDDTTLYPEELQARPSVGYLRQLAAEGILALRPERLIVSAQAGPREVLAQLDASGVDIVRIPRADGIAAIPDKIMAVARALDRETQGRQLADSLGEDIARLEALEPLDDTRAMFLLSHSGMTPMVAGHGTEAQQALRDAGIVNAFAHMQGYKSVGAEALIHESPQAVIATHRGLDGVGGEAGLWRLPGLSMTPAGQDARVVSCEDLALLGFGPRTPGTLLELRQALERTSHDEANGAMIHCQGGAR